MLRCLLKKDANIAIQGNAEKGSSTTRPAMLYVVTSWGFSRAKQTLSQILPALPASGVIIDIGSGFGHVSALLSQAGYHITPLDIKDRSRIESLKTVVYDGKKIPFKDKEFDVALLLTILHHDPHPKELLEEALRVATEVVIIEDIYKTTPGKYLTYFIDSLLNWEWTSHPHANKTEEEWERLFSELGLKIIYKDRWFSLIGGVWPIRQVMFKVQSDSKC